MKKLILVLVLILLVAVPAIAQELDPEGEPTFLEVSLPASFLPDPFIVTALAGGDIDAGDLGLGDGCAGLIASTPDVRLNWTQGDVEVTGLRIFFISEEDTTLVVQTPSGEFLCNDDNEIDGADVFSPTIDIMSTEDGAYNIWIGTYLSDELAPGYLMFTELADTFPGQISNSFLGVIVQPEE